MDFEPTVYVFPFEYYGLNGIPDVEYDLLKLGISYFGRSNNVAPMIVRRIDPDRMHLCGVKIGHFVDRRCVWVALPLICIIFELEDVRRSVLRRLQRGEQIRWWRP